jgi:hypothetical protein
MYVIYETEKGTSIKYVLSYINVLRNVSVASATIIRVSYKNTKNIQSFAKNV